MPGGRTVELDRAILEAVRGRLDGLPSLLAALVREQSLLGNETPAQDIVTGRLAAAGFAVERIEPDAEAALADPHAGYPPLPYRGRSSVVGLRAGSGGGSSLHLSGHIDVVPVDPDAPWEHDPWGGELARGRIWGRGAGDMKGGLAAYLLAAEAVVEVCGDAPGDLAFSSVIEEECGGNGFWAVLRAGYRADATLIGEPTGLAVVRAGTGVVWARLRARGQAGHSAYSGGDGPFDELARAVAALRRLEASRNEPPLEAVFEAVSAWPYGMTVGRIGGGVWTASAPASLEASIRFGIGLGVEPAGIQREIVEAVAGAAPAVEVAFEAFRAPAYCHDTTGPFPTLLQRTHADVLGSPPGIAAFTATTDARQVDGALCYGPLAGSLHGGDEWVDLASLEQTATVVALTAARWIASENP
ncbi:MAG TPA: M20/M25/M40 family metallo-hydrolase [Gaiellaceae bacterium]|nr:M20/M25/M40 family metallo-hydrolase [Gaiellaceae bacterium]